MPEWNGRRGDTCRLFLTGGASMIEYEGIKWPNGARMAVSFTIHVDGNSLYNWRPVTLPRSDSYGNYGPEQGVDKILELTKDYQVPCTYYVP